MTQHKVVALVSGGMDSAAALYWTVYQPELYEVTDVVFFAYGQRGVMYEMSSVRRILEQVVLPDKTLLNKHAVLSEVQIQMPVVCALISSAVDETVQRPGVVDKHGNPVTFVPARNLLMIAYATSIAYVRGADTIIGGWNSVDVDYPDCRPDFIAAAACAASLALGHNDKRIEVVAPLQSMTKADIVKWGTLWGVPWDLTRSCYSKTIAPCLKCDSCLVRARAFVEAGIPDPIIELFDLKEKHDEALRRGT